MTNGNGKPPAWVDMPLFGKSLTRRERALSLFRRLLCRLGRHDYLLRPAKWEDEDEITMIQVRCKRCLKTGYVHLPSGRKTRNP
jgi:hypothetical protein